ncbi:RagB/SusD family nutrient uptake outer membrane protein [Pedobacter metabolipauper]|uniref:Putative outer membrane starch-binding protein n=1 Tax=Pedobacter metabolipauper TaxID=425513 RepID=A0A4V3D142_9SPHI|nr:RagB/SusD family nutrient uptake outer membrane protein [Pedobacter metabolipauper]TDQ08814.1 putative outer membrane starch-binding protein [Pedobacter metabolipauper]
MKSKLYIFAFLFTVAGISCTKVDENAYDQLLSEKFYNNKNEVLSAVLRPYTHANAWVTPADQRNWWEISELSSDQLAWPTKGRHGEDGGKWKRLHYHTWNVDDDYLNNAWVLMYWGMGLCNDPIEKISSRDVASMGITQEEKDAYIAELKLLRAFHYLKIMDLWGNIPVATEVGTTLPQTMPRAEVFAFIEKEIKENIEKTPVLSRGMLGRMSQAGGYAMLVELYLNAEAWTGTPRWDDCIAAADKLISGQAGGQNGAMALDPNISDQFKPTNDLSKEVIFSIAYDYTRARFEPSFTSEFYHFKQREIYGGGRNGNNGVVVIPGVYTTFGNADLRKTNWLRIGPQVKFSDGTPVTGSEEYTNKQLEFVDNIRRNSTGGTSSTMSDGEENSGVRFDKYKISNSAQGIVNGVNVEPDPNYNNTDWNVYRLTWIYFAKAEALMRKNAGTATPEAVQLINDCKKRAYSAADWAGNEYTVASLTLTELLAERGREFIFEGFRRDDLIRFGKFTTASWWDHQPTTDTRKLFPIPQQQRSLNTNLTQNSGYN